MTRVPRQSTVYIGEHHNGKYTKNGKLEPSKYCIAFTNKPKEIQCVNPDNDLYYCTAQYKADPVLIAAKMANIEHKYYKDKNYVIYYDLDHNPATLFDAATKNKGYKAYKHDICDICDSVVYFNSSL